MNTVDSVVVTARPDPEDPAVVADARKRLSETPGAVSVISSESYESRFALALDDMLRDAPGVYAQRKWGGDTRDYRSFAVPGVASTFNLTASKDYDWITPRLGRLLARRWPRAVRRRDRGVLTMAPLSIHWSRGCAAQQAGA